MFGPTWLDEFEGLIGSFDVPVTLDASRRLHALHDRFEASIAGHTAEVDAAGLWHDEGARSMKGWLRSECRQGDGAGRTTKLVRALRELPVVAAAMAEGSLSRGQVDAIVANLGRHTARFADCEAELVATLVELDVDTVGDVMRAWKAAADAVDEGPAPKERLSEVHLSATLAGRGVLSGELDAELTQLALTALRTAERHAPGVAPAVRRAEALREICRQFLDAQGQAYSPRHRRHRPHLNVIVQVSDDGDLEGRYVDGPPVEATALDAMVCDCRLHRVLVDPERGVVGYGRAIRTIPVDLFNALVVRDGHCRWPGCTEQAAWCDGHHLTWWRHGGSTDLSNLALLCRAHHRMLHTKDPATRQLVWQAELAPDGTFTVTNTRRGLTRTSRPPGSTPRLW